MRKLTDSYNLKMINPCLAKEWHPTKNGNLTPKDVTPSSGRKVWWICNNYHEWIAKIDNRAHGTGCPFCSGNAVCLDNCLHTNHPKLAKQWHPIKNGKLTPNDITPGCNKKVWWKCEIGHEWPAIVKSRVKGARCPYCTGKKASKEYNLQVINPKLAWQWHPTKNKDLKPQNVTPKSGKNVWWRCKDGHEWKAVIAYRSNGVGCPYCAGRLNLRKRNLIISNITFVEQWHPKKIIA
jgi:hypothetical protein